MMDADYFGYRLIPHAKGCKSPRWEVLDRTERLAGGDRRWFIRIVCPQPKGCGVYHEWRVDLCTESDPESGDPHSGIAAYTGPVEDIGYGTAPVKVDGVWLHAGRPLLLKRGEPPEYYLVTASPERPRRWQDLLGVVGQLRSPRSASGFSRRWYAATGYREYEYGGGASPSCTDDQRPSRTAAVRWVVEQTGAFTAREDKQAARKSVVKSGRFR
ncbi:hypothetical protein MF672_010680 [Actinomadura sp. ATCC 31491]|uniref:Uncharacterized protein n=1 Tax=Actinomadura luzonensis TaxID=2805427 RepID=A0ABT0FPP6_9ACTN|nr:hypothetical protein [Actinomadura luzonensis]MCK2214251.1 hypothetical protein [Actinomadura luzonensis]